MTLAHNFQFTGFYQPGYKIPGIICPDRFMPLILKAATEFYHKFPDIPGFYTIYIPKAAYQFPTILCFNNGCLAFQSVLSHNPVIFRGSNHKRKAGRLFVQDGSGDILEPGKSSKLRQAYSAISPNSRYGGDFNHILMKKSVDKRPGNPVSALIGVLPCPAPGYMPGALCVCGSNPVTLIWF